MPHLLWNATLGILVGVVVAQVATYTTTIYLHRTLAHRAMTVRAPLQFALRVLTWLTTGIRPRQWVAVHRKHHAFTDLEGDPHSPARLGWKRVQLANVALYRREASNPRTVDRYAKDLPATRLDRLLFDHAVVGLALGIAVLVWVFGPWVGATAAVVHAVTYIQLNSAVNAVGHTFGRRPYDNSGTNLQWLAVLTGGEGLHNNHHAAPTSATMRLRKGEFDPAWPLILAASKIGLVRVRLAETKLAARRPKPTLTAG